MASTYSALKIELIGTGEQSGTWGTTTNTNLGDTALGEAITGSADVAFSSGPVTLTLTDTNASQTARNLRLNLTGTSGGAQNLIVPNIEKLYLVNNGCADVITVKNSSGTGIAVPAGKSMFVFNTGTNVVDAVTHATSLTLGSALPVASGGTGVTSSTGTGSTVLSASPTFTGTPIAPTAAPGTNTTQIATTAFVTAATGTLGTMSTQNASSVAITGGTINGTTLGATTAAAGTFTTLNATAGTISGATLYGSTIAAGSFVVGSVYTIAAVGTTSFTSIGASANTVGITFVATGVGSGTGTAYNYFVGSNSTGAKTISTSTPSGGNDGDIWYQI